MIGEFQIPPTLIPLKRAPVDCFEALVYIPSALGTLKHREMV
tara:strand:- start:552 stop:677 length:126 start_codon:yes stop_codon:yes gene_type:complete